MKQVIMLGLLFTSINLFADTDLLIPAKEVQGIQTTDGQKTAVAFNHEVENFLYTCNTETEESEKEACSNWYSFLQDKKEIVQKSIKEQPIQSKPFEIVLVKECTGGPCRCVSWDNTCTRWCTAKKTGFTYCCAPALPKCLEWVCKDDCS